MHDTNCQEASVVGIHMPWVYNTLCVVDVDVCYGCGQRVELALWVWLVGVVFAPDANSKKLGPMWRVSSEFSF
jgi:hypothetical protein